MVSTAARLCAALAVAGGLLAAEAPPAAAQTPALALTVEAGLDGFARAEGWVPVRAQITNAGPTVRGTVLSISTHRGVHSTYARPVELPADSRREVLLYVKAPRLVREVLVQLRDEEQVWVTATARVRVLPTATPLIVSVSNSPEALPASATLRGFNGELAAVAFIPPERLPDQTAAWDAADMVVVSNVDTAQFTRAQREALVGWVLAGGHLILGGGPAAREVAAGFEALAPARVRATTVVTTVKALEAFLAPYTPQAAALVSPQLVPLAELQVARSEVRILAGTPELPLLVRRFVGRGVVDQLAFDAAFVPAEMRPLLAEVLGALARGDAAQARRVGYDLYPEGLLTAASAAPVPALMPVGAVVAFLLAYFLLVGPINFWAARRVRQPALVLLTAPLLTLGFTALGLIAGYGAYDLRPQTHRLSLWLGDTEVESARDFSAYGVRALRRSEVGLAFDHALAEVNAGEVDPWGISPPRQALTTSLMLGIPSTLRGLPASLNVRAVPFAVGARTQPIAVQATLRALPSARHTPAVLEGEVRNLSAVLLQDCALVVGRDHAVIGNLEPQRAASVRITLTTGHPQPLVDLRAIQVNPIPGWVLRPGAWTMPRLFWTAQPRPAAPFDRSYPPLHAALVSWLPYEADRVGFFARLGLIVALFADEGLAPGSYVACWSNAAPPGAVLEPSNTTDRSLHLWRAHPQPWAAQAGQVIQAELFAWDAKPLSGTIAVRAAGLVFNPGEHLIVLESWLPLTLLASQATLALGLRFDGAETPLSALQAAALAVYDWGERRFVPVATDLSAVDQEQARYTGRPLSADGRVVLKLVVRQGSLVLSSIRPIVEIH